MPAARFASTTRFALMASDSCAAVAAQIAASRISVAACRAGRRLLRGYARALAVGAGPRTLLLLSSNGGQGMGLGYERMGSGPPLLLLHGTGHHRRAWDAVTGYLAPAGN